MRVSDENNLGARTPLVKAVHRRGDGIGALPGRISVCDASAGGLATAGRIHDGLGGGSRISALDLLDERARRAVAGTDGGLPGSEDVNGGTGLGVSQHGLDRHEAGTALQELPHIEFLVVIGGNVSLYLMPCQVSWTRQTPTVRFDIILICLGRDILVRIGHSIGRMFW